jgi:PAS domain S-box-containing protein
MNNGEKEIIGFHQQVSSVRSPKDCGPQGGVPHRILVIDDNPNIHEDFKTILLEEHVNTELDSLEIEVLGRSARESVPGNRYELDFASQGKEGHEKIKQALSQNRPYELAFVDMRMPPGWDGLETIEHIWKTDPNIQVVICTAFSDHSWEEITQRLGRSQNLLILKKPFDSTEVAQLATALTEKWTLAKQASMKMEQLEQLAEERTHELEKANEQLQQKIAQHRQTEKALKKSKEFLTNIINALDDPVFVKDQEHRWFILNDAACEVMGRSREELIGKSDYDLFAKEQADEFWEKDNLVFETGQTNVNEEEITWHGNLHTISTKKSLLIDSVTGKKFITGTIRDITERKQVELRQDELIKKVDHINKDLKEFASIVSHDLKAPLRGIKTLANWILSDCGDKLGDQANEQMNLLLERVERMYSLIEGALQYSRAGRTEEKRVQVNLNNFVPEIINMVVPPENITVTIENELPVIECEEVHIMQVLQNLLSNAIKYMDKPQGWIKVGCVEQDGFWKFSVADNGPGIEEKHFEKIFKIFQALPTSPYFEGTGVGLTVAKKIVELYDGKIWVESKVGEGSTFFFTLPKQKGTRLAGTKMGAKK